VTNSNTYVCATCQRELPSTSFNPDASKASGHRSFCKSCDRRRSRNYYKGHRKERLAYDRRRRHTRRRAEVEAPLPEVVVPSVRTPTPARQRSWSELHALVRVAPLRSPEPPNPVKNEDDGDTPQLPRRRQSRKW
jgi:hypothetical protein